MIRHIAKRARTKSDDRWLDELLKKGIGVLAIKFLSLLRMQQAGIKFGEVCPSCGYKPGKFSRTCPKCRNTMVP